MKTADEEACTELTSVIESYQMAIYQLEVYMAYTYR